MDIRESKISVLMFPWLAHGHISPFLELAKKLSNRNFHIYLCSTPINLTSIKPKISQKYSLSIQLVELHLPSLPDLPPHYHTTKGLPPHLMSTLKMAFHMSVPNFSNTLKTLNPNLLIYDILQPWAPVVASSYNIPAIQFLSTGAAFTSFADHLFKNTSVEFPFPSIYLHEYEKEKFNRLFESSSNGVKDEDHVLGCRKESSKIVLIKTFREIEVKYIDYLSVSIGKKMVPVGPLVQDPTDEDEPTDIIEWLDKKEKCSTVFVSFGSECFLSREEMEEVANGLELSEVNFIWVIRFPVGEKIKVGDALPEDFVKRIGERGLIVEGWAPQMRILEHSSVGGFVSHCGWSSVMEGMKFGVPIIAMPMQLDQPINARLVEEVGVGVEVKRKEDGRLDRKEIAKRIRKVVVEKSGEDVRRNARELSEKMKRKGDEEIDKVVQELLQVL
ncbi:hypothetical protein L1049_011181 [Liquidambar formosana]|uniref:Glycosyltransferase n=1 Tax=Liquidambar formosana TaxID=63359 RepID=A0AAP0WZK6_LIQFO